MANCIFLYPQAYRIGSIISKEGLTMDIHNVFSVLNRNYDVNIQNIELFREGGNCSYVIRDIRQNYFLKIIRAPFLETALQSIDVQMYLLSVKFPVIPIILTKSGHPYVHVTEYGNKCIFVLFNYVPGDEPAPEDTENAGKLIGRLHQVMKSYPGKLAVKGKDFFIDRYVDIMKKVQYEKTEFFLSYGNELWERVKDLPREYCHCDLYRGNLHKTSDNSMYVLDFDTSCIAFPVYDIVLFCNDTHYFDYDRNGYVKTKERLEEFVKGYQRYCQLSQEELSAFYSFIAIYHFQLQATMLELHGYDSSIVEFFDKQYDWLFRWESDCQRDLK